MIEKNRMYTPAPETHLVGASERLVAFAKECFDAAWQGGDLAGDHIQDLGLKFGLIEETKFDPRKHHDPEGIAEEGMTWYEYTDTMLPDRAMGTVRRISERVGRLQPLDTAKGTPSHIQCHSHRLNLTRP